VESVWRTKGGINRLQEDPDSLIYIYTHTHTHKPTEHQDPALNSLHWLSFLNFLCSSSI